MICCVLLYFVIFSYVFHPVGSLTLDNAHARPQVPTGGIWGGINQTTKRPDAEDLARQWAIGSVHRNIEKAYEHRMVKNG